MAYELIITERAEELLDELIYYLLFRLKSEQAASHLLDAIESIYKRLEENPLQFPLCKDLNLASKHYREAFLTDMHYLVIYKIEKQNIFILGIFHELERYESKI